MIEYIFLYTISLFSCISIGFKSTQDYKRIHNEAIIFDGHNDAVHRILSKENLGVRTKKGHIDIPRLKDGGIDAVFFSVWVPPADKSKTYFDQVNLQIDALLSFAKRNEKKIELARPYSELLKIQQNGKIAMMISMEGGHPIGDDLTNLDYFYKRGVTSIMPTWNNSTNWATSSLDETQSPEKLTHKGLTELGKKFVRRMDSLGIIIDVSHSGETTFWDIIETSRNPIIASHSGVWKICPHHRNLKDDQIRAIAASGGLVAVNFYPGFLDSTFTAKEKKMRKYFESRIDSIKKTWNGTALAREKTIVDMLESEYNKILPSIKNIVDHIDYIVKLVGADYVGLGSDFDGISVSPRGLKDISYYPEITKELLLRGYNENDIKNILGGNFLRVLKIIEARKK